MFFLKKGFFTLTVFLQLFFLSASSHDDSFEEGLSNAAYYCPSSGNSLRYAHFIPSSGKSKKTVVFVEGRGTFLEFYRDLISHFLERGYDVWLYDLTGQGGSERLLEKDDFDEMTSQYMQHVDDFRIYSQDLEEFVKRIVEPQLKGSALLSGYSTGAHVALRYLEEVTNHPFDSAFMISPLLTLNSKLPHTLLKMILWGFSHVYGSKSYFSTKHEDLIFRMNYEGNPYTSSKEGFEEIKQLCFDHRKLCMGGVSCGWLLASSNSIEKLWEKKKIESITLPVMLATGGEDGVVRVDWNENFTLTLPSGFHTYYPQGRHELFREKKEIRDQLWDDFDLFMLDIHNNPA